MRDSQGGLDSFCLTPCCRKRAQMLPRMGSIVGKGIFFVVTALKYNEKGNVEFSLRSLAIASV